MYNLQQLITATEFQSLSVIEEKVFFNGFESNGEEYSVSVKLPSQIIIFKINVGNEFLLQKVKQMYLLIQNESLVSIMTLNYLT